MRSKSKYKPTVPGNGTNKRTDDTEPTKQAEDRTCATQPQLGESEAAKLRAILDKTDKPFRVAIEPVSRKRKRESSRTSTFLKQDGLWEDRLTVWYDVQPAAKWNSLKKFRRFRVGPFDIATGQCILVRHDNETSDDQRIHIAHQWKAKVLEIRALDQEHVYIRLAWLNRPEDLDEGRQPHHGKNELIPTNELDIIDAMTVNGPINVQHWRDDDDDSSMVAKDQYFWRQTYDYAHTQTFTPLRRICTDDEPQNPDEMILQCSNKHCRKWLHLKCIAEQAVQRALNERARHGPSSKDVQLLSTQPKDNTRLGDLTINQYSVPQAHAKNAGFAAEVYVKGLPSSDDEGTLDGFVVAGEPGAGVTQEGFLPTPPPQSQASDASFPKAALSNQIVITMPDGSRRAEALDCLICGHAIED